MTELLKDFITGREIPHAGAEANRQALERVLVNEKGYDKPDILVDDPVEITVNGEPYCSVADLALCVGGKRIMVIKCAAGSLFSWEREILAAARLMAAYQIPLCAVSDGKDAVVFDTVSGKQIGEGLAALPSRQEAESFLSKTTLQPLPPARREKTAWIFRSYDSMKVNRE